jgi:hypothetical protein
MNNNDFINSFFKTIQALTALMATAKWEDRKTIWAKLGSAKNIDEYCLLVDCYLRKKVPDAPHGIFSDAIEKEITGLDIQEFHKAMYLALNDPGLDLLYMDAIMPIFSHYEKEAAGILAENMTKIMTALCTACGSRWHMNNDEFIRMAKMAIKFNHSVTSGEMFDYFTDKEVPQKTDRLCGACDSNSNLGENDNTRLIAGRDKEALVGKTRIFCAIICKNCPHIAKADSNTWESLVWENRFPCMITDVELLGQSF